MIVGDGEGGKLLKGHILGAERREQDRGNLRQRKTAIDDDFGCPEPGGDVLDGLALIEQRFECFKLVGGVHRLPHHVLGQA